MKKLYIINDHNLLRQSFLFYFSSYDQYSISGDSSSFLKFLDDIKDRSNRPDILIFFINNLDDDSLNLLDGFLKRHFKIRVVIVIPNSDFINFRKLLSLKIDALILQSIDTSEILFCLDSISSGNRYVSPDLLLCNYCFDRFDCHHDNMLNLLSKRERTILSYIASGMSNKEISFELHISESTVKNHIYNLFKKIDCTDRSQAILFAIHNGLHN